MIFIKVQKILAARLFITSTGVFGLTQAIQFKSIHTLFKLFYIQTVFYQLNKI